MGRYAYLARLLFPAASALAATCRQWAKEDQVPNNELADDVREYLEAASPE